MRVEALDYNLPEELIATRPIERRDQARMMVVDPASGGRVHHARVRDLPAFLRRRDLLILNDTAVAPARFHAVRKDTGGRVGGLYLESVGGDRWRVMLRSNGRLDQGMTIALLDRAGENPTSHMLELIERERSGVWRVQLRSGVSTESVLDAIGLTPLPPYILRARGETSISDELDRSWYQTVYADRSKRGSVAAPTAGLHFTPELFGALESRGVACAHLTLHVGAGTFQPVRSDRLEDHPMHEERIEVAAGVFRMIDRLRSRGGRSIAVGTTSVRALESVGRREAMDAPPDAIFTRATRLMIAPGYAFKWVDGMLTNFHLPRSTLLALVGALVGVDRLLELYQEAIERRYRFYSYGDCMLILPSPGVANRS